MSGKLIFFGDLCADMGLRVRQLPLSGQDGIVESRTMSVGGAAANCAICATRLGARVELLGVIGRDSFGELILDELKKDAVGVEHVRTVDTSTGLVIVAVDPSGERTMFSFRGANACDYGPLSNSLMEPEDCLYLSGYSFQTDHSRSTAIELLRLAKATGAVTALDPSYTFARDVRARHADVFADLDFLFPNQVEARLLSGSSDVKDAAAIIKDLGVRTVVVTLGAEGCYVLSEDVSELVPTCAGVNVVDTTGAGDAFCAGFLTGVLRGMDCVASARMGHEAAAEVIGVMGSHKKT